AELLVRAEEFAARDVAVAVAVHLAEPARAGGSFGRLRFSRTHSAERHDPLPKLIAVGRAAPHVHAVLVRDFAAADLTVAVAVKRIDQFDHLPLLAHTEPAVAVGIDQVEQAAALVLDR